MILRHLIIVAQRGGEPGDQRVGAQIFLHHQVCGACGGEPRQPRHQQVVQRVLADADRRVRPDRVERQIGRHLLRRRGMDVLAAVGLGVGAGQVERAFVHVHGPDVGLGRGERQRKRHGSPSAAQIQQRPHLRRLRHLAQQHRRAQIQARAGEHAVRHLDHGILPAQRHLHATANVLGGRFGGEILFGSVPVPLRGVRGMLRFHSFSRI